MLSLKTQPMESPFEHIWETGHEYARRVLIGLTRDIDLADDLLQETYLRARDGFPGYRGGDAKAWLTAVAKNVFYTHARRKYVSSEVTLDSDTAKDGDLLGSTGHIASISLRQAIADLPEALRQALIMKHYGGFTYSEIAQRLGCPQGTAQQRVFTAIRRLRIALGTLKEEMAEMKCGELSGKKLVDYAYGKLQPDDAEKVMQHLAKCPKCRNEVDETVEVFRALDAVECDFKVIFFLELWRCYLTVTTTLPTDGSEQQGVELGQHWRVVYAAMGGDEVAMDELPNDDDPDRHRYHLHLPESVAGKSVELLFIGEQDRWDTSNEETLTSQGDHSFPTDAVYLIALSLDNSHELIETSPEPTEIRRNGHTTVYYRGFLPEGEKFEWKVQYKK